MPETMSPREKVALKPCPFDGGKPFQGSTLDEGHYVMCSNEHCLGMVGYTETADEATEAWNRRAALASSGDHAELARLADMADWLAEGDPGASGSVLLSASVAAEHAGDLKALIAEVAALREERDAYFGMANRSEDAWLKAERKLTEARETLIQADLTIRSFPGADQSHVEFIRTFLSKEAERG